MIAFSSINKQYGKQILFVDASFQLNPGEKVGLVGPERIRQDDAVPHDCRRGAAGRGRGVGSAEADSRLLPAGRRGDVRPFGARRSDRGQRQRLGALHHELEELQHAMADPAQRRRDGRRPRALRRGAGRIRAPRRLRAREPHARDPARPRVRRRADRRRRRARCRAAGRCASRWRACCSASPTSC